MTRILLLGACAAVAVAPFATTGSIADDQTLRDDALALFEPIPESPDPAPDPAQVELGKALFFEPRLSEGHNISCNTCHNLGTGGADLASVSLGHRWQKGGRNSPTVLNATYNTAQFWDGRAADLTEQAGGPMVNPVEMGSTQQHVVEQLKGIPGYLPLFAAAFPKDPDPVNFANAEAAIAAFEQTLITPDSPFDRFLRGDDAAMTADQKEGLRAFIDQGCAACHNGINLGGNSYQPFGLVEKPDWAILPPGDKGRFEITRAEEDAYVFKVPTLRNIAVTPPYFHSGAVWDLSLAVDVMGTAQLGAALDAAQAASIVDFLDSLTGEMPQIVYPTLPPSTADTPRPQQ
ncbi:cytochrome C peroxidase [Acuticoccus sediminis]|uniref:Cytochrome C peroxidase n=1 Tax=Acuticoccus sediminis TaxID=2184697 RepID=A0A8B2NXI5_9HYPH|nr:cytochrome-c peroxidase [Acuticoccus sediminis]RAI03551.1 cytochrome C peroxidase [Acuticoccus sediminis]